MAILLGSLSGGMQPTAPTIGTATAGDTTASVAFTASSYIGKGTITYTATSSPGGLTATGASSPLTVTGLTNGTAYTFTVVGNTNYGVASVASAASNSITPATQSSYESIATYTVTSTQTSITFSSISQTYKHLQLRVNARQTTGASFENMGELQFNGDTGNNYGYMFIYGSAPSGEGGAQQGGINSIPCIMATNNGAPANVFGAQVTNILDYTNTNKAKTVSGFGGADGNSSSAGSIFLNGGMWNSTSAINSITFKPANTAWQVNSVFALYGIKG